MPDIGTSFGIAQAVGLGFGLLLIIALRSRRYGTDLFNSFIWLWTALGIGLGIYASVELAMPLPDAVARTALIYAIVAVAAWFGSKMLSSRSA